MLLNLFRNICPINFNILNNQRYFENIEINLNNCFFTRINNFNGNGGIIYVSQIVCNLIILESTFYSCISNGEGGAIYWISETNSNSILKKICSNSCITTSGFHHQFSYNRVPNNINYENSMTLGSLTNSSNDNSYRIIMLRYGNVTYSSTNCSNNNLYHTIVRFTYSNHVFGNYNTLFNNKVILSLNFYISWSNIVENSFIYSNFVNLSSPTEAIILMDYSSLIFSDCLFINNRDILFWKYGTGSILVKNCIINHLTNTLTSNEVTLQNNSLNLLTSTYLIHFYSTYYCINFNNFLMTLQFRSLFERLFNKIFILIIFQ